MSFLAELSRRNVFKVAVIYVVAGWLVLHAVDIVFPALQLPDWTVTLVVALLVVGFPFAILMAWAFELTPEGLKRDTGITGILCDPFLDPIRDDPRIHRIVRRVGLPISSG